MGQVLHGSATTTTAIRRAIQHSQESLRALARRYGINPKTQVEETGVGRRPANWPKAANLDGAVDRGGGDRRRLSPAHLAAARRLPLCAAGHHPALDPVIAAPLLAATWHLAQAPGPGRPAGQAEIQNLSARLFPH